MYRVIVEGDMAQRTYKFVLTAEFTADEALAPDVARILREEWDLDDLVDQTTDLYDSNTDEYVPVVYKKFTTEVQ